MKIIGSEKEKRIFLELLQQFSPEEIFLDNGEEVIITNNGNKISVTSKDLKEEIDIQEDSPQIINDENLRKLFYKFLKKFYNKNLDWGMLTGVKPVKLYRKVERNNFDPKDKFLNSYEVAPTKTELVESINNLQKPILDSLKDEKHLSIYIGIPICPQKCTYCSFISTILDKDRKLLEDYLNALEYEIKKTGELLSEYDVVLDSIYIGGGTPSILNEEELERLIQLIKENFDIKDLKEFSFEAGRSDTLSKEFLEILKKEGITRICLNPQTMNKETLKLINRNIDPKDLVENFNLMRDLGFDNINMDLIVGLGEETEKDFLESLNQVINLNPENITIHDLSLKKGSKLKEKNGVRVDTSFSKEFLNNLVHLLEKNDYFPYYMYRQKYTINNGENIGYTKKGFESFYNIVMMAEEQSIIGIGAGSSGKLYEKDLDRFSHVFTVKDIKTYNNRYKEIVDKKLNDYRKYFNSRKLEAI